MTKKKSLSRCRSRVHIIIYYISETAKEDLIYLYIVLLFSRAKRQGTMCIVTFVDSCSLLQEYTVFDTSMRPLLRQLEIKIVFENIIVLYRWGWNLRKLTRNGVTLCVENDFC